MMENVGITCCKTSACLGIVVPLTQDLFLPRYPENFSCKNNEWAKQSLSFYTPEIGPKSIQFYFCRFHVQFPRVMISYLQLDICRRSSWVHVVYTVGE